MQFTSLAYLGFFAAVFAVHWAVPQKARWAVCLAASAGFYALLGAPMLAVLALCIAVSYLGGLWLQRRRGRRPALALAAVAALAPLLFFKYFNTLLGAYVPESVRAFSLLTPVGISFFTFKAVAYLAEVYKGALPPCRHFGRYALYVSFFPEVSMGPIQRPGDLMAQIGTPRAFDAGRAVRGAQLMLWDVANVHAVHCDAAGRYVVKTGNEVAQRRLAAAGRPYESQLFTGAHIQA